MLYIFTNTAPTPLGLVQAGPGEIGLRLGAGHARANPQRAVQRGREREAPAARRRPPAGERGGGRGERGRLTDAGGGGRGGAAAAAAAAAKAAADLTVQGLPLIKPPYGRITAIDMNKGTLAWQIAHGDTPDNIKNHPALKGLDDSAHRTAGTHRRARDEEPGDCRRRRVRDDAERQRGAMLRAYDKATGQDVGAVYMPAPQTGSPMTYSAQRQAIHRRGNQRRGVQRRTGRIQTSVALRAVLCRGGRSSAPIICAAALLQDVRYASSRTIPS